MPWLLRKCMPNFLNHFPHAAQRMWVGNSDEECRGGVFMPGYLSQ
jgi:hypothetical protein